MNTKIPNNIAVLYYNKKVVDELTAICRPLFNFSQGYVKALTYHCFFPDQTHFSIGTDLSWMEFYLLTASDYGDTFVTAIRQTPYNAYRHFLWPSYPEEDDILSSLYEHNLWNGMSVLQRRRDYIEMWSFASTKDNGDSIKNFYINHLEEIRFFIQSFRYKTARFIENAKNRPLAAFKNGSDISYFKDQGSEEEILQKFFKEEACPKKFFMTTLKMENIILTKREYECLAEISKGKTYKEVARALSAKSNPINSRTVEFYVNNIKGKFKTNTKSYLIESYYNFLV